METPKTKSRLEKSQQVLIKFCTKHHLDYKEIFGEEKSILTKTRIKPQKNSRNSNFKSVITYRLYRFIDDLDNVNHDYDNAIYVNKLVKKFEKNIDNFDIENEMIVYKAHIPASYNPICFEFSVFGNFTMNDCLKKSRLGNVIKILKSFCMVENIKCNIWHTWNTIYINFFHGSNNYNDIYYDDFDNRCRSRSTIKFLASEIEVNIIDFNPKEEYVEVVETCRRQGILKNFQDSENMCWMILLHIETSVEEIENVCTYSHDLSINTLTETKKIKVFDI